MYPGSMTFKQKWADLRAMPGSSQYHVMVTNIENSVSYGYQDVFSITKTSGELKILSEFSNLRPIGSIFCRVVQIIKTLFLFLFKDTRSLQK